MSEQDATVARLIDPAVWDEAENYRVRADEWFAKGRTTPGDVLTDGYREKADAMQAPLLAKAAAIRELLAASATSEPQGKAKCPGCNEVVFQDHRWENKQTGMVSCGWCGWNPATGEQACLVPASAATPARNTSQIGEG